MNNQEPAPKEILTTPSASPLSQERMKGTDRLHNVHLHKYRQY